MENRSVGFSFRPTDEELINYYLKNKIMGKAWVVDDAISEINIYFYEPKFLPSLSKIVSKDPVWYFFYRIEYNSAKRRLRTVAGFGLWKLTGDCVKIKDKRGQEIGIKRVLVYIEGRVPNAVRTDWVMHEYHFTGLPHHQRTHIICKIMYKGAEDLPSGGNNSSELCHSLVSDSSTVTATTLTDMHKLQQNPPSVPGPVSDSSTVRATTLTDMQKLQQNNPSVQRPVSDSNTARAASLAKMYKLLEILPSVERHGNKR